jgi:hypothetical protein
MVWTKGESGNPGGISSASLSARAQAQALAPAAFRALKAALKRPGERVTAATVILDRAYGKVPANVHMRVISTITDLSDDELMAIAGDTEGALQADNAPPLIEHDEADG